MTASEAEDSQYRADVDGLRAVAIVPVVLFHAGLAPFSGGFVGVDVFFVISGFLITSIIKRDLDSGKFSLYGFYERRMRRIFPSLFVVMLATVAFAALISPPNVLLDLGKTIASSAVFSSNLFFWSQAGYFDDNMHRNAMLHTWSLSVEEQFYLFFPLLLTALLAASMRRTRVVIAGLLAASLALAVWATTQAPSFAFYLMPARAWELLLGAALALGMAPALRGRGLREVAAVAGLLLVAWSAFSYSASTPFPGFSALAPCLGAALMIHAGGSGPTAVGRVLAWWPVVFIGLISYPLYLWHWPIIVFAKDIFGNDLRYVEMAGCIVLSVSLATASWRLLERPVRGRAILPSRRSMFVAGAVCLAAAIVGGAALQVSDGMPWRYPPAAQAVLASVEDSPERFRTGACFVTPEDPHFDPDVCLRVDPDKPNILLMGDSHAAHFWYGLDRVFTDANVLQVTASGCRPVLGGSVQGKDVCRPLITSTIRDFLPKHRMDTVVLAANWWNGEADLPFLPRTVACLERYADRVVVIGPINSYDRPLAELLAGDIRDSSSRTESHRRRDIAPLDERMSQQAREHGMNYLSVYQLLCGGGDCREYAAPGLPMQFDKDHLTAAGSVYVARRWREGGDILGRADTASSQRLDAPCG